LQGFSLKILVFPHFLTGVHEQILLRETKVRLLVTLHWSPRKPIFIFRSVLGKRKLISVLHQQLPLWDIGDACDYYSIFNKVVADLFIEQ